MNTFFKLVILLALMWGAYSYGYRNCEKNYELSMKQATEDVSELADEVTESVETALTNMKSDTNAAKNITDD